MSFDKIGVNNLIERCLSQSLWNRAVSFDALVVSVRYNYNRLNPFGTGQCLSTEKCFIHLYHNQYVSIPLEQGSVFRQKCQIGLCRPQLSQSLWNRAVSFDEQRVSQAVGYELSQSLWNRAVSFDKEILSYLKKL